jgi:three-Cys-motif partner protein
MTLGRFHDQPFDEGTLTKLEIFQLYAREWLPVFLASPVSKWPEVHLFDFFAGPGTDSQGVPGSPVRFLRELRATRVLPGWRRARIVVHFFDAAPKKIEALKRRLTTDARDLDGLEIEAAAKAFREAFSDALPILQSEKAAKLVFIDQFGVDQVLDDTFLQLVGFPTCDFLFFLSSSTLNRFRDHPAIKLKIRRPDDPHHVHLAALEYYRSRLPDPSYFLAPFSIKKGANIYGLIFGSRHPKGMGKFLNVAWKADEINGAANFDINRDDFGPLASLFDAAPTKLSAFEADLERAILAGRVADEADAVRLCFEHGVRPQHAELVIKRLKGERKIECSFRSPQVDKIANPRPIRLTGVIS